MGWFLQAAGGELGRRLGSRAEAAWVAAWCVGFLLGGARLYATYSDVWLPFQRADVQRVADEMGDGDWSIMTIDAPIYNVLLRKRNVTRYMILIPAIEQMIEDYEPGGFRGWLTEVRRAKPDLVVVGSLPIRRRAAIQRWLRKRYETVAGKRNAFRRIGWVPAKADAEQGLP